MAKMKKQEQGVEVVRGADGEFDSATDYRLDESSSPQAQDADVQADAILRGDKVYFIVNPKGAIHEADRMHAKERLAELGWRLATPEEIAKYHAAGGNQRSDLPIAPPWQ